MGGWDDDTAVQRKAQLRLLSSLPALRLQDSAKRAEAAGIAHPQVPEVRRSLRRDGRPETHQYLLSAALPKLQAAGFAGKLRHQASVDSTIAESAGRVDRYSKML